MNDVAAECCPKFDPQPWDQKEVSWDNKKFIKDRVRSFLHVPLNFSTVMKRNQAKIAAAGAGGDEMIVITDENSLWGSDVYIAVEKDVPGATNVTLSGNFLCKVFDGPFRDITKWIRAMQEFVVSQNQRFETLYFYYTTCPRCAKKQGHNYVVLMAQIS